MGEGLSELEGLKIENALLKDLVEQQKGLINYHEAETERWFQTALGNVEWIVYENRFSYWLGFFICCLLLAVNESSIHTALRIFFIMSFFPTVYFGYHANKKYLKSLVGRMRERIGL